MSVSVSVPSLTVITTLCTPALEELSVPLMTPVVGVDGDACGQVRGAVGERRAIGIGGIGIEADESAFGVAWSVMSVEKTGAWLVLVTSR